MAILNYMDVDVKQDKFLLKKTQSTTTFFFFFFFTVVSFRWLFVV